MSNLSEKHYSELEFKHNDLVNNHCELAESHERIRVEIIELKKLRVNECYNYKYIDIHNIFKNYFL